MKKLDQILIEKLKANNGEYDYKKMIGELADWSKYRRVKISELVYNKVYTGQIAIRNEKIILVKK